MTITVVIPTFNQARYLADAIRSALAQTHPALEIIVIDDGSTDATPDIVKGFHEHVRYIRQPNQGLAGARNAGIAAAGGDFIALLDSDDVWRPDHLALLATAAVRWPEAVAWISSGACIDAAGRDLPQSSGHAASSATWIDRRQLLRANAIIPSAALLHRERLVQCGGFATDPRIHGCEDWDLWLRLSLDGALLSLPAASVGYRLHPSSMSTNLAPMAEAARHVMERAVGAETGDPTQWPADKRWGWGGAYRFCALTSLIRAGDWPACVDALRRALAIDPSLARDSDLFYELALGTQPLGYRGSDQHRDLNVARVVWLLDQLSVQDPHAGRPDQRQMAKTAWRTLALAAYNLGDPAVARAALRRLLLADPRALVDATLWPLLLRATVAWPLVRRRRLARLRATRRP